MNIIHGTWIPGKKGFENKGFFALWVETLPPGGNRSCAWLNGEKLKKFFSELSDTFSFKIREPYSSRKISFLLPTIKDKPLPSPEIANELGLDFLDNEELSLQAQEIECAVIKDPVAFLPELIFFLEYENNFGLPGKDLFFWRNFSLTTKNVIRKHAYIPSLVPLKKGREILFAPGWEPVSIELEKSLKEFAKAMPLLSRCFDGEIYEPEEILRHFAGQMVNEIVQNTPFSQKIKGSVEDTFIRNCLEQNPSFIKDETSWREWKPWRDRLTQTVIESDTSFTLGFKLYPPDGPEPGTNRKWFIQWLAISNKDPSYMLPLEEYWRMNSSQKKVQAELLGANFEEQLLLQLSHAARIYPAIWSGLKDDHPSGIYCTEEDTVAFLKEWAFVLEDSGFKVILPSFLTPQGRKRIKLKLRARKKSSSLSESSEAGKFFGLNQILDYDFQLSLGDQAINKAEWQNLIKAKSELVFFRGEWILLNKDEIESMVQFLQSDQQKEGQLTLGELLKIESKENLLVPVEIEYDDSLKEVVNVLSQRQFTIKNPPSCLQANLREYQKRGFSWLYFMERLGLGALLADDMGLGKTLQVISHIAAVLEEGQNPSLTLLVVPTSVIGSWKKEIARFAPDIRIMVHHGPSRIRKEKEFKDACRDVHAVLTSFATARVDAKIISSIEWTRVVVDEAQNIKNPKASQTKVIYRLNTKARFALTGTPIENRLSDLWSIFNFLNPGYLGNLSTFRKNFEIPISCYNNSEKLEQIKKLTRPFILRRVKTDKNIIKDLPEKMEQKVYCHLTKEQASLYQTVVKQAEEAIKFKQGIDRKGLIFSVLMQLKQICNHPAQFLKDGSEFSRNRSHKLDRVASMIEEVIQEGESALVFTQFKECGAQLERFFKKECRINTYFLHGEITRKKRERMIEEFQSPDAEPSIFILTLKAGGVGITLTRANHVFHFDRWWNPAVENQATDRAYRIGQKKNVFIHKMVSIGTLEERIDQMLEEKAQLARSITTPDESWLTELDDNAFRELIRLSRDAVLE